jgi:hypothetical protein
MRAARQAVRDADHRFPVRIRIGVPPHGLGERIDQIGAWLDANCGADGWAMAADGLHSVLNHAIAIFLRAGRRLCRPMVRGILKSRVPTASSRYARMPRPLACSQGCTRHREAVLARSPRTCRKSTAEMRGPNWLAKTHKVILWKIPRVRLDSEKSACYLAGLARAAGEGTFMWPYAPAVVVVIGAVIVAGGSFWQGVRQSKFNAEIRAKMKKLYDYRTKLFQV